MSALLAVGFWTAVALVFVLPELIQRSDWQAALLSALAQWWSWGLLAPLITTIDQRLPFSSQQVVRRVLAHLALAPVFAFAYVYLWACVAAVVGAGAWAQVVDPKLPTHAVREMFWSMLVYGLIVILWQAYHYQQRYLSAQLRMERLEHSFAEARLNALRMQLDPHFLFNALNTISAQLEREPRLARTMIEHLGDLLRLSLSSHNLSVIPLAQELTFLDHYLAIQKIRFGDSLRVEINLSAEVEQALVPSLLLQPLVENAIRHGLAPRAGGGTIILGAERIKDQLHLRVLDDGVGLPTDWTPESPAGLGLSITRERIMGLHPDGSSSFAINRRAAGGTAVEMSFPLRLTDEAHDRRIA